VQLLQTLLKAEVMEIYDKVMENYDEVFQWLGVGVLASLESTTSLVERG
jgi:hypothetical protein